VTATVEHREGTRMVGPGIVAHSYRWLCPCGDEGKWTTQPIAEEGKRRHVCKPASRLDGCNCGGIGVASHLPGCPWSMR